PRDTHPLPGTDLLPRRGGHVGRGRGAEDPQTVLHARRLRGGDARAWLPNRPALGWVCRGALWGGPRADRAVLRIGCGPHCRVHSLGYWEIGDGLIPDRVSPLVNGKTRQARAKQEQCRDCEWEVIGPREVAQQAPELDAQGTANLVPGERHPIEDPQM